jgi:hypothetical protein
MLGAICLFPLVGQRGTVYLHPITRTEERSHLPEDAATGEGAIGQRGE